MTEVASGVPTPRSDSDATSAPAAGTQSGTAQQSTQDSQGALERAQEFASRAGEVASEVAERVSEAVDRAAHASGRVAAAVVDRLRNNAEFTAERGKTTIANEVVEKIAGIAAREVPGVYDLGGDVSRMFAAVKERIGIGERDETSARGVSVVLDGSTAAIDLTIVIEYGFVVFTVTEKVRAKVISAVENLLGLEVTEVNILVDDVHVDDSRLAGEAAKQAVGQAGQAIDQS